MTDEGSDGAATASGPSTEPRLVDALMNADLAIVGHLSGASNATLLCAIGDPQDPEAMRCVYKPRRGERPLWDFPTGTLGRREVGTALLASLLGWPSTPTTVWRDDGPLGPGMCQEWVDDDASHPAVDVMSPQQVPDGWRVAWEAQTYDGDDVVLVHEDTVELRQMALLDVITNNADRKGGHVLRWPGGEVVGIDHGLTFHVEPKLRTVLWGWAGEDIAPDLREALSDLARRLIDRADDTSLLDDHLAGSERQALIARTLDLVDAGTFPDPIPGYPALPWPPL